MPLPKMLSLPKAMDPRLVTKTSLPKPKKAIALLILLWFQSGKPGELTYGKEQVSVKGGAKDGILDEELTSRVEDFFASHGTNLGSHSIHDLISDNPLVTSQAEALNAAFELVWHLASFELADSSKTRSSERKDQVRFRKVIHFTCNLDLLELAMGSDNEAADVLLSWLTDGDTPCDTEVERRMISALAVFSETSFYKTNSGPDGIVFAACGVYDSLESNATAVELSPEGAEAQGTTRILKSAIKDGLNPLLRIDSHNEISLKPDLSPSFVSAYSERARNTIAISNVKLSDQECLDEHKCHQQVSNCSGLPNNLIYFGAPGTGKSYELNENAVACFGQEHIRRVTFHPEYSYASFIGCYKPVMLSNVDVHGADNPHMDKEDISYSFVPGPFIRSYIEAIEHNDQNYVLIVEEINRANTAAVFGDMFQLLDRHSDDDLAGLSVYSIDVPDDLGSFLFDEFHRYSSSASADPVQLTDEEKSSHRVSRMRLPSNLYIWATMNSADQGVYPMDTAFKRRWNFRYMSINEGQEEIDDKVIHLGSRNKPVYWNDFRIAINKLLSECKINEDKLIGPFFLDPATLDDNQTFLAAFKSKVILYLFEDAAKMKREKVFAPDAGKTYSEICATFDAKGEGIFNGMDLPSLKDEDITSADTPNEDPED